MWSSLSFSLPSCLFFSLENAVSTMFVTRCTLAEPLLKVVWNPLWIGVLDLLVL